MPQVSRTAASCAEGMLRQAHALAFGQGLHGAVEVGRARGVEQGTGTLSVRTVTMCRRPALGAGTHPSTSAGHPPPGSPRPQSGKLTGEGRQGGD